MFEKIQASVMFSGTLSCEEEEMVTEKINELKEKMGREFREFLRRNGLEERDNIIRKKR